MSHVIIEGCLGEVYAACVDVCPVECIYEGGRMMYIQPGECIDCGLCLSVCPVDAIYAEGDLPEKERVFGAANAEFFGPGITGWGSPGGADARQAGKGLVVEAWVAAPHEPVSAVHRQCSLTSMFRQPSMCPQRCGGACRLSCSIIA